MSMESRIAQLWKDVLGLPRVGLDDNFFETGGTSLLAAVLLSRLNHSLTSNLPIAAVFQYPTVRSMAGHLKNAVRPEGAGATATISRHPANSSGGDLPSSAIAIIGITGRFPGADTVEDFWRNLCEGVESVTAFEPGELEVRQPESGFPEGYVAARPILEKADMFDADFFGVYPKEAEQMDPQHRVFLECAWEVLERAGYDPAHTKLPTGVFAGCSMNTYFMKNLATDRDFLDDFTGAYQTGSYVTMLGNDKDFLPTRISYKLNLRGPSITVQSACSTSLVAVCQASQSLLAHGCDMALAGAVSITFPQRRGYLPQEGGIGSLDGHCRPFDHHANGTVFGHGAAVLLLKRLEDAVANGDQVLAVIRGFAVNNDGAAKVGYTAPSVEGQAQVVLSAQKMAGVTADSITYLEAHGTGTPLGDPIEVTALNQAFRATTKATQFCALGTAKANVGHLDVAAGATGLIKTVLQIENRAIPRLLHFEQPNPHLGLEGSPFFINRELIPWTSDGVPLRAGVSAFGVGGTNAHVIVEEPPYLPASDAARTHQLLVWSAKTSTALDAMTGDLAKHLSQASELNLADAAYTLQVGRSSWKHRRALVAATAHEAAQAMEQAGSASAIRDGKPFENPSIAFCFPGQGAQTLNMGRALYGTEPVFQHYVDLCDEKLRPLLGESLLNVIYKAEVSAEAAARLNQTLFAQPAIFVIEYALAQLWLSWGIRPNAMIGHSVGEYVAACMAGVFSLDDALTLISARCHLMQDLPRGSMLAVRANEETVSRLMGADLDLAAVNSPQLCVVSGPDEAIEAFRKQLDGEKILHRNLATSHAFHSRMVEPMLARFAEHVRAVRFNEPAIPYVSTLTGKWITAAEVAQPEYWTRQLRQTVRFAAAAKELANTPELILLEVGPGETLVQLMRQTLGTGANAPVVVATLAGAREGIEEEKAILTALGRLWTAGATPDWQAFHSGHARRRTLLPTYPFERKRYWVEPPARQALSEQPTQQIPAPLPATTPSEELLMTTPSTTQTPSPNDAMLIELKALIADLSGTDLTDADSEASFLELGFDSLFLTQLTQGIQGKYKVKVTFRQIMENFPTLGELAAHLETTAAPRPVAAPAPSSSASLAAPVSSAARINTLPQPATSGASASYEALFASQLQAVTGLIQQQLDILRGQPSAVSGAPEIAAPAVPIEAAAAPPPVTEKKPAFIPFKPLQRGEAGGLNPVQDSYLKDFIGSYNARTPGSKKFTQEHRHVFADGRVVSGFNAQIKDLVYPLVVERASGAYLWDKDGNRYIDILNGFGAILYGHSPSFIVEAVRKQLDLGFPIGPQTELAGDCAELISELTGMERVTFSNTGSEAVMGAMRLARTVTGRNLVVVFTGDYHGSFDEVLVKTVGNQRSMPIAPGIPRESVANMLVLEYGSPESLEIIRSRADELAAVLVEPVQSRHPELQPVEFLREVRRITEQSGTALIFDEVVTGFRTHLGGMQAVYGIRADLATYGKVVAGGLPIGILAGSRTYMDALDGGMWQYGDDSFPQVGVTFYAGTFMRHPLAMAAVKASLLHLKNAGPSLQTNLAAKTASLVEDINTMLRDFSYPSQINTFSSWFYFGVPTEPRLAKLLHFHLREQGIHIQEGYPCFLTTAHTDADLQFIRDAFHTSLRKMQAGQALSHPLEIASTVAAPKPAQRIEETQPDIAASVAHDAPLTEQQREILLATQLGDRANCAFNESTSLRLTGSLNEAALHKSLDLLVSRHEALRSTIDIEGEVVHIAAPFAVNLIHDDLSNLSPEECSAQFAALLHRESSTPFDLIHGPLFRMRLVQLAPGEHVLIFVAHHIIFDGWSTNVLYSELSELYNATARGQQPTLDAALTFSQYARQQKARMGTPDRLAVEAFWLDQFKTVPSPLQLPTDRPRPALRENEGATRHFVVGGEVLKSIRKAGAKQGSTLFATLLSGFALFLHRITQQDDVVIGIPVAGQAAVENGGTLVGHCVNFLPVRSNLQADQTLSQFVKQTRKTLLNAQDHQDYTYGTLLHQLKIASDPARLKLVEVQFNVEQVGAGLKFDGLTVDLSGNPKAHVNMDLFFNFVDRGNELWLDCDYNAGLFDASTIDRWFGHLEVILQGLVNDAGQPASQLSLLTSAQREQLLVEWNQTATDSREFQSIHHAFEEQAEKAPSAIAVIDGDRSLTYAELNEKANQLARFLHKSGVAPGTRVALCLDRSLEAIVSLLGILKAGASYVPLDPSYPQSRLSYLVHDSAPSMLLTQRSLTASLSAPSTVICQLDHDWPSIALEGVDNLPAKPALDEPAYVMYTSGSTGDPKGVIVPHRAILRLVKHSTFASFSPDEVFLQLAPLSFDASTFEIWGALLNGGKLVVSSAPRATPEDVGRLIAQHNVTTLWLTAAFFHLIVTEHLETLRPLRQLLAGGDVLSLTHVRRVCEQLPHLRLINGYGPTENTTFTCCHPITIASLASGTVPIGRPIGNTRIYILDAQRNPVPVGVIGDLYAAGDGVALGYLNAPELTAAKFVEHTFDGVGVERLYRTGDLARYRADGTVEFLGRADTQVKIRGYRIETSEIEQVLERSPLVRSAVVMVRTDWVSAQDNPGDKRLAAYIIPEVPSDVTALRQSLRSYLQEQLPDYMQPAAILLMESFPRTLNGKVDRRALPAPQPEQLMHERVIVSPRNEREATLAAIWTKVLGLNEVGVDDNIFELGGDSLSIFRISTQANQAGLPITALHMFRFRTISAICAQLADTIDTTPAETSATIQAIPRSGYRRSRTVLQ